MRTLLAILATAGGFALLSADAQACSARGTHCGHPDWAANAFEGPRGSHAKDQIDIREHHYKHGYAYGYAPAYVYGYKPAYGHKKHYRHKKH
ncbi:MAG: hypothetical protein R3D44_02310 [Hyphomicrobiaceae bacterium]